MKSILLGRVKAAPETRPITRRERAFVSAFSGRYRKVRYSGRPDLEGLQVLGQYTGFEILRDPVNRRLFVQALDVEYDGSVRRINRTLVLRRSDSLENLIPGIRGWVS